MSVQTTLNRLNRIQAKLPKSMLIQFSNETVEEAKIRQGIKVYDSHVIVQVLPGLEDATEEDRQRAIWGNFLDNDYTEPVDLYMDNEAARLKAKAMKLQK
jgi:hypothetical protein